MSYVSKYYLDSLCCSCKLFILFWFMQTFQLLSSLKNLIIQHPTIYWVTQWVKRAFWQASANIGVLLNIKALLFCPYGKMTWNEIFYLLWKVCKSNKSNLLTIIHSKNIRKKLQNLNRLVYRLSKRYIGVPENNYNNIRCHRRWKSENETSTNSAKCVKFYAYPSDNNLSAHACSHCLTFGFFLQMLMLAQLTQ